MFRSIKISVKLTESEGADSAIRNRSHQEGSWPLIIQQTQTVAIRTRHPIHDHPHTTHISVVIWSDSSKLTVYGIPLRVKLLLGLTKYRVMKTNFLLNLAPRQKDILGSARHRSTHS